MPKFLAVLHIINDPQAHGFDLPTPDVPLVWEGVTITKQVQLKTIAKRLDVGYGEMKGLNPELRRYLTPKESYVLKVPKGKAEGLLAQLGKYAGWPAREDREDPALPRGDRSPAPVPLRVRSPRLTYPPVPFP